MLNNVFTTTVQKVIIGGLGAAVVALGAYSIHQHFALLDTRLDLSNEQRERATERAMRESAARIYAKNLTTIEGIHRAALQEKSNDYDNRVKNIASAYAADALRNQRLLTDSEGRAAGYRRLAESGADSCKRLADKAAEFDRLLAEGLALGREGRKVIDERDAAITLLNDTIDQDRAAIKAAIDAAAQTQGAIE